MKRILIALLSLIPLSFAQNLTPTPVQTEGPYYPVNMPSETDNDLTSYQGGQAQGESVVISGKVLLVDGRPLANATVEIWQTDNNGTYLHPREPKLATLDPHFQSFGTSVTDAEGNYSFTTIVPGLYEGRPRHIHFKVKYNDQTLLTSQFYFSNDPYLARDGIANGNGSSLPLVTLDLVADSSGAASGRRAKISSSTTTKLNSQQNFSYLLPHPFLSKKGLFLSLGGALFYVIMFLHRGG
ncbi:MAG: hypothetical protein R2880_16315 [Deinococcales bacterium]